MKIVSVDTFEVMIIIECDELTKIIKFRVAAVVLEKVHFKRSFSVSTGQSGTRPVSWGEERRCACS